MEPNRNATAPSTSSTLAFFAKYRQTASAASSIVPQPPSGGADAGIMTQASNVDGGWRQRQAAIADTQTVIPVDRTKGTPSFRLATVRSSPRNMSPALDRGLPATSYLPAKMSSAKITLVLDVDETLVHSSYEEVAGQQYNAQMRINCQGKTIPIFVKYRPHLKTFFDFIYEKFEVVIFTASLRAYCDPLMDELDPEGRLGNLRLFREHCTLCKNSHVKDLFCLGRPLEKIVIVDNSPNAYLFQQRNALPIKSWFDDQFDVELLSLMPVLSHLSRCTSVYDVLDPYNANGQLPEN